MDAEDINSEVSKKNQPCSFLREWGMWPPPKSNLIAGVIVTGGKISYVALALNIFNPEIAARYHPDKDVRKFLLAAVLVGDAVYYFNRPHLAAIMPSNPHNRFTFSIYQAAMNTLGSLLLFNLARPFLPEQSSFRAILAVGASMSLMSICNMYVRHLDTLVERQT